MTESNSRRLSQGEFIALMGMMFATIAFSIDSMLPALPEIANELTPDAPNLAQLVLTSFVFGMLCWDQAVCRKIKLLFSSVS